MIWLVCDDQSGARRKGCQQGATVRKKIYYKQKSKGPRPYPPEAKARILAEYDRRMAAGDATIPDIIDSLDASPATVYRWLDRRKSILTPSSNQTYFRRVEAAIQTLCSSDCESRPEFVEAIFIFVIWMRWPRRPDYMHLGMAAFLSAYYSNKNPQQSLAELDDEVSKVICRYLRLSDIQMLCCEAPFDAPLYERYEIDDDHFDDGDVVAAIVWVLINIGRDQKNPRKSASLNKAFYLVQEGSLDINWIVGRRYLDKLWKDYAPAAPFLYVERYNCPLLWSLTPGQPDLRDYVDDIVSKPGDVRAFFGHAVCAVNSIAKVLDPRALQNVRFPTIPIEDGAFSLKTYPLSSAIKNALKEYGRSSKYMR